MKSQLQAQVAQQVASLSQEKRFQDQSFGRVVSVLRAFLPPVSCNAIAEDAVSEVTLNFLERLPELDASQLALLMTEEEGKDSYLRLYLLRGVHNYALDRYRRWRGGTSSPESQGSASKRAFNSNEPQQRGARPRLETDDLTATIEAHEEQDDGCLTTVIDLDRLDQTLEAKGLSTEEIEMLKARLSGFTFKELAELHGGSPDKYRKIVARALKRSGLKLDF